jgi:ubiquinone/menaquinone biosynthesis C-methylase UbiE
MDSPKAGLTQRIFAWALARYNQRYESLVSEYKSALFADVAGTVVEIGPGTGSNLRYLVPGRVRWTGIEPNLFMQPYLQREADRLGLPIDLRIGTANALPCAESSVDAVICTLVLCCVPSQEECLREVLRVLKPGGKFIFIEHVAASPGSRLRRIQNFVTPLWKRIGDGCHPNRETWVQLERAGFAQLRYDRLEVPIPVVRTQIFGTGVKAA